MLNYQFVEKDDSIYQKGDISKNFYIILYGKVQISVPDITKILQQQLNNN